MSMHVHKANEPPHGFDLLHSMHTFWSGTTSPAAYVHMVLVCSRGRRTLPSTSTTVTPRTMTAMAWLAAWMSEHSTQQAHDAPLIVGFWYRHEIPEKGLRSGCLGGC